MCHKSDVNPCMEISMKVVTSQSILFSEGKLFLPRQMWWFNDISAGFPVFREYRRIDKPLCWHQTIASCSVESLRPINSERGGKKENYSLQPECHIPTSMSSHCLVIFHISLNGPTNTQHCQKLVRDRPLPKTLYKKGFISAKLCLYLIPGGSSWSAFQSLPQPEPRAGNPERKMQDLVAGVKLWSWSLAIKVWREPDWWIIVMHGMTKFLHCNALLDCIVKGVWIVDDYVEIVDMFIIAGLV